MKRSEFAKAIAETFKVSLPEAARLTTEACNELEITRTTFNDFQAEELERLIARSLKANR